MDNPFNKLQIGYSLSERIDKIVELLLKCKSDHVVTYTNIMGTTGVEKIELLRSSIRRALTIAEENGCFFTLVRSEGYKRINEDQFVDNVYQNNKNNINRINKQTYNSLKNINPEKLKVENKGKFDYLFVQTALLHELDKHEIREKFFEQSKQDTPIKLKSALELLINQEDKNEKGENSNDQ